MHNAKILRKMLGQNSTGKPPINRLLEKIKAASNESAESGISFDMTPNNDQKEQVNLVTS